MDKNSQRQHQQGIFDPEEATMQDSTPVTCLGMSFENDDARREYFLSLLREGLEELHAKLGDVPFTTAEDAEQRMKSLEKWPMGEESRLRELAERMRHADSNKDLLQRWKDEVGFPHGAIEDILKISDPPYYTACPNPFIGDFIEYYGKPYDPNVPYSREPFAADVSEGKNDPIYNAHSYHTKVPHKAIMRYILHYTEPGDVVFDGFCGTGMTGVAAQLCGDRNTVESLGYMVDDQGIIYQQEEETDESGKKKVLLKPFSKLGARRAVLNDLSPAATFIAYNYNTPVDVQAFEREAKRILKEVEDECGWMYETLHVEPASSRLMSSVEFEPCDPFKATPTIYRKDNLPHVQVPGATYFITFRTNSHRVLSDRARELALKAVLYWNDQRWKVFSASVMPDHIHIIAKPLPKQDSTYWDLAEILHSIKSFSANEINKAENKTGTPVWQTESYDRIIRDAQEFMATLAYVNHNPVKAGLAEKAEEYPFRYVASELVKAGWKPAPLGKINYTVWSDVFICPECTQEVVFWEAAVDKEAGKVHGEFPCPHCSAKLTKRTMDRAWVNKYDKAIGQTIRQAKQVPVLINYSVGKKRFEKAPDAFDLALIEKIEELDIPYWFPTDRMPEGEESRRNDDIGLTHVHHFYTKRNLWVVGALSARLDKTKRNVAWFTASLTWVGKENRLHLGNYFGGGGGVITSLRGTWYIASLPIETNVLARFALRRRTQGSRDRVSASNCSTETASAGWISLDNDRADYIFTDPPFGGNLMYSELNFLWEAWLKVFTNNKPEAIENKVQGKGLAEYHRLMTACFKEYYRVLKPGRWMTVEFHNSKSSVWNSIQEALQTAGFVIADVRTLDKKKGSFKQVTSANAVKQDLVISCYKPNGGLEERFKREAGTEQGVWDFVRTHLKQLPVFVSKDGQAEVIAERQNYLLFDRMVAFHVQRGVTVPLSAAEFYAGLAQRFPERDGMYFLPDQVAEYDKKRMNVKEVLQLEIFVTGEASAIQWLKQQLVKKPQTFQELHPQFLKEIGGWQKHEKPLELSELLEQNFLRYDGKGDVPSQIHSYLSSNFKDLRNLQKDDPALKAKAKDRWYVPDPNKAGDLEKLRERSLLKEFEDYRTSSQKRLKVFRLEAVRAGFKKAWQERDYATIITVARKIPENILQEDPKLLMWYDQAVTRMGGE